MGKGVKKDPSYQMKIRQYLVKGRRVPDEDHPNTVVFGMRIFAVNKVEAKSLFWKYSRERSKVKKGNGEILSVNELHEKNPCAVKTYGVAVRFPSRSNHHNIYKEYRDLTVNGAISQLYMELASRHRVRRKDVAIIRVATVKSKEACRRKNTRQFFNNSIKFPQLRAATRPESRKFHSLVKASRPTTIRS